MTIQDFISKYKNHPILFIGTGISLRYLNNSFSWDDLLAYISHELYNDNEPYLSLKSKNYSNNKYDYAKIALELEKDFDEKLEKDRNGKFKEINDKFFKSMEKNLPKSKFKIYISKILSELDFKKDMEEELKILKQTTKNIGSIITTNYDELIETIFNFSPLIGNDILLSNPYGSVYKIHGSINKEEKIIITSKDYEKFDKEYELIRAQLLSLFIHNPIIFIGYSIEDSNIKKILRTIFYYVDPSSDLAKQIKDNFLLIEYEKGSKNNIVNDYDINMDGIVIRINKIATDDFISIYKAIANLQLPISAMDVRKVQSIVKEIYSGGNIKVNITENLDDLKNEDKILAIGSKNTIQYQFKTTSELINDYFKIIEVQDAQYLSLIDKIKINENQYFPIFAFNQINTNIKSAKALKKNQKENIENSIRKTKESFKIRYTSIDDILSNNNIAQSYKDDVILWNIMQGNIKTDLIEEYLKAIDLKKTKNRKLLCAYDLIKYGN